MEPFSIIAGVTVNWLVRFLKCSGEEVTKKAQAEVGSYIWDKVKNLFRIVDKSFQSEKNNRQEIEMLKRAPDDEATQLAISLQLAQMMKTNENLSKLLNTLIAEVNKPVIRQKIDQIILQTNITGNHNVVNQVSSNQGGINIGQVTGGHITINQQAQINIQQMTNDALRMLRGRNYEQAYKIFTEINEFDNSNIDLPFYLSLSVLAGRRPKILKPSEIEQIENYLEFAVDEDGLGAHYYYLVAIILYEFYYLNGYTLNGEQVGIQTVNGWLARGGNAGYDESIINEMFKLMPGIDKEIADIIKTQ